MSDLKIVTNENNHKHHITWLLAGAFILGAGALGGLGYLAFRTLPLGQSISNLLAFLFATNTTHTTWYITRAAGWVAYFLLWFSMVWGLAIPSKFFERVLSPTFAVDFHEYISLLSLGFIALHVGVLMIDQYLPFTLVQILVPFMAPYRPFWVGLGVLGFYLSALVTVTFYLRKKIGQKLFKKIHVLSLVAYLGVVLHAFLAGSDSSLGIVQLIYLSTFMVVVFLTSYWIVRGKQIKQEKEQKDALFHHHNKMPIRR
jgi:predicted ferric reductase